MAYELSGILLERRRRRASRASRGPMLPRLSRFLFSTWWGWATVAAVVAVTLAAVAFVVLPSIPVLTAACELPLELRVLASPESYPAIQGAADQYSNEQLDDNGCRTVHLAVYPAPTGAVLRAFGQADHWAQPVDAAGSTDSPCPGAPTAPGASDPTTPVVESGMAGLSAPGRDIGPQPDIWFPDSTVDVQRAEECLPPGSVRFDEPVSVARSPLVWGVPDLRRAFSFPEQLQQLQELREAVTTAGLTLVRPNPTTSTAGLLHSVGLYKAVTDSPNGQLSPDGDRGAVQIIEDSLVEQGVTLADTADLLCNLDPEAPLPAVLVSERALLSYNLAELGCGDPESTRELVAYYPDDLIYLNYPLVKLTWLSQTGDEAQRDAAVEGFREWLLSPTGQQLLPQYGLRPTEQVVPQDLESYRKLQSGLESCLEEEQPDRRPE
jgi:Bacterial extracellular solute-binding protein